MSGFSTLKALAGLRCPTCHKGRLFINPNPFNFKTLTKMPEKCPECGHLTQPEPGFYYGAMYISYGLCVALFVVYFALFALIFPIKPWAFIGGYSLILVVLWPIIFRYARGIYLYLFG